MLTEAERARLTTLTGIQGRGAEGEEGGVRPAPVTTEKEQEDLEKQQARDLRVLQLVEKRNREEEDKEEEDRWVVREAEKLWKKQKMGKEDAWLRTNEDRPDGGFGGRIVRDPDGQTQLREERERQRDQERWRDEKDKKEEDDRRQENKNRQEEEWNRQERVEEELRRKGLEEESCFLFSVCVLSFLVCVCVV